MTGRVVYLVYSSDYDYYQVFAIASTKARAEEMIEKLEKEGHGKHTGGLHWQEHTIDSLADWVEE